MVELKKCPFCGESAAEVSGDDGSGYFVACCQCWTCGPIADTKAKAVKYWNRRSGEGNADED